MVPWTGTQDRSQVSPPVSVTGRMVPEYNYTCYNHTWSHSIVGGPQCSWLPHHLYESTDSDVTVWKILAILCLFFLCSSPQCFELATLGIKLNPFSNGDKITENNLLPKSTSREKILLPGILKGRIWFQGQFFQGSTCSLGILLEKIIWSLEILLKKRKKKKDDP